MAWGKAGSTTLTSTGDVITVNSLSNNKCIMILNNVFSSGQGKLEPTLNNDTGSNYAARYALDGAAEVTLTSQADFTNTTGGFTNGLTFHVQYLVNIATEEKLLISQSNEVETTGAGTAPRRREYVGKWANTSDAVSRYDVVNVGSGDFASDSNSTVIGSDITPAAAVPAISNVQNNSLFVEKENARRYWFDGTNWTMQPTLQDDFSSDNFTQTGTEIDVSGGELVWDANPDSTTTGGYIDIGETLSDTAWLCRFKLQVNNYSGAVTTATNFYIQFQNITTVDSTTSRDSMGIHLRLKTGNTDWRVEAVDGAVAGGGAGNLIDGSATTETIYVQMYRDGNTIYAEWYDNADYTGTPTNTANHSSGTPANLRYFAVYRRSDVTTTGVSNGIIDDLKIYNGVTSIN